MATNHPAEGRIQRPPARSMLKRPPRAAFLPGGTDLKFSPAAALLTAVLVLSCAPPDMSRFYGEWQPDLERTLAANQKSAESRMQINPTGEAGQKLFEVARMTISRSEIVFSDLSQSRRVAYSVRSASGGSASIEVVEKGNSDLGTFTLIEGRYLRLTTRGGGDIDYLIWKRVQARE